MPHWCTLKENILRVQEEVKFSFCVMTKGRSQDRLPPPSSHIPLGFPDGAEASRSLYFWNLKFHFFFCQESSFHSIPYLWFEQLLALQRLTKTPHFSFFPEDPSEMGSAHPCSKSSHSWSRCPGQAFPNISPFWSIRLMETQSPAQLLSPLSWRLVLSRLLSCPRRSPFTPFWTLFGHRLYIV